MLVTFPPTSALGAEVVIAAASKVARAIPPLWPLASSVAVNPFLGQTGDLLATAAARLRRVAGAAVTLPRAWYVERLHRGEIEDCDLLEALHAAPQTKRPQTLAALKQAIQAPTIPPQAVPTVADLAAEASGFDWPGFIAERLSHWAAAHFDQGQALWAVPQACDAFTAWRIFSTHDLTPEIFGLEGFAATVTSKPEMASDALVKLVGNLGVTKDALETYFHRLLMSLGGWSQFARYKVWQAELLGGTDGSVTDLLAIRLVWEEALYQKYAPIIERQWLDAIGVYEQPTVPTNDDYINAILQESAERAGQRWLGKIFVGSEAPVTSERPALQMAFCIDVRSEVFRRALESIDPRIRTLGFAGFFGLGIAHQRFASDVVEARLPVLLAPEYTTSSGELTPEKRQTENTTRICFRAKRAWGRFKLAAISSFAFVESTGPLYVSKMIYDGLSISRNSQFCEPVPRFDPALRLEKRIDIAESVLRAMSLTADFARLVLFAGHCANLVNNPHLSALHCGACGGYSGEVNARLIAGLLNDNDVRKVLRTRGIRIPDDTLFLGALHDTTTDKFKIFDADYISPDHRQDIDQAKCWLATAGALTRMERAPRLPHAYESKDIARRARDWAEVRPEWGLAGCAAFIAAPRHRTAGRNLSGRVFLHDYDWRRDKEFRVLELILTAPVVVASWISLQYYGSAIAPEIFGAGNKLLHNVTGGIGVVEGNGGLLRAGLPWQSVHDGKGLVHEPLRLSVLIEAPCEAIGAILDSYPAVRDLFDNKWLHLLAIDDLGRMAWRYRRALSWEAVAATNMTPEPASA